ncbi:RICIN domain-containing protein [Paenibacillus alba]|uniref:RICIN domain-containing protein n=1 Tax=Paenibacillus alba TaxID=1197127 RepID=A0ABU6G0C5_9BACL|nr:RICIN domain-containing protein [Paenibacillus alba]MEC0227600.1 RICIN domain-containing protein [Paenibacillus alba]
MKRFLIRYGLIAIVALVLVVTSSSPAVTPTTYASGTPVALKLINVHSLKALSVSGWDKLADGALIQQYTNLEHDDQKWYLENLGNGYYNIRNAASGDLLDVNGASTSDGANVIQWPSNNGWNQQWQLIPDHNHDRGESWFIKNRNSGKLLEMSGASTSDFGQAIQWYDNGGENQRWFFLS